MMECRYGDDGIKGLRFQCDLEHITANPFDVQPIVAGARSVKDWLIDVESDDMGHPRINEVGREDSVTASDIEDTQRVWWKGGENQAVVVRVRVPAGSHQHDLESRDSTWNS